MNTYLWIAIAVVIVAIIVWMAVPTKKKTPDDDDDAALIVKPSVEVERRLNDFDDDIDGTPLPAKSFTPVPVAVTGPKPVMNSPPSAAEGLVAMGDFAQQIASQGFCEGVNRYASHTTIGRSNIGSPHAETPVGEAKVRHP